jgi:hypothetical protein
MKLIDVKSIVSVFQVSDIEKSLLWYKKWLGEPDVIPMEGVAEYELSKDTWLQLSYEGNENIEKSAIIIGIEDIKSCKETFENNGIKTGEIQDYEIVLVFDIHDPDGNRISFVQEV